MATAGSSLDRLTTQRLCQDRLGNPPGLRGRGGIGDEVDPEHAPTHPQLPSSCPSRRHSELPNRQRGCL
ncbi:hypothetical protein PGT21_012130 [Puccinia graminis f. sp. tritici]|uniref:Uncharacterized protein n=1 Tax=Puccinia graminis f. sp. tritici TaxID=56615 RepID=A0A5B0MEF2_PUCGR|nr:hypothetical protein PGT21_012130 [Puccinia graminis f. sp. tritici]